MLSMTGSSSSPRRSSITFRIAACPFAACPFAAASSSPAAASAPKKCVSSASEPMMTNAAASPIKPRIMKISEPGYCCILKKTPMMAIAPKIPTKNST